MKTFKYKSLNNGGVSTAGTVEAESAENAIKAIKEQCKFDPETFEPGNYVLTAPDEQIQFFISQPPQDRAATETRKLHSFGWKVRLVTLPIFPGLLFIVTGFAFYLSILGQPNWLFGLIVFTGFFGFGITRMLVQVKMLESFVCPHCKTPTDDWQRDSKYKVYYKCRQCRIKWDIGYKYDPRCHP